MKNTINKILEKHLQECFDVHSKTLPVEYHGYILRAMKEYKNEAIPSEEDVETERVKYASRIKVVSLRTVAHMAMTHMNKWWFKALTKDQVENDRSKANDYLI